MAWTAIVKSVEKQPSVIFVTVEYTDGDRRIEETYKLYAPPDGDWLKRTTTQRIAQLEGLAETTIPLGAVDKWQDPTDPQHQAFVAALRKLERIKLLIDMKILQETDQRVIDFISGLRDKVGLYWDKL